MSGGIVGFLVTFMAVVDYAAVSGDRSECDGGTCALELAAIVTWALAAATLVGVTCGLVVCVLTRRQDA